MGGKEALHMDRKELEGYILDTYGIEPDYPWKDQPDYAVFRHPANRKWFALIMRIPVDRIGRKEMCIRDRYSSYKDTVEKKNMGFVMNRWDEKLLKYGKLFEDKLMSLSVNLSLEDALDLGWQILADCFEKDETGMKSDLIEEFWPEK